MTLAAHRRRFEPIHYAGFLTTIALHGGLIAAAFLTNHPDPPISAPRDFVVAKLVRLGKPRPKELLPKIAEPAPVAVPVPNAVKLTDNAQAVPVPPKKEEPPKPVDKAAKPDPSALKRAADRARLLGQQQEEAEGSPTGSASGTAERAAAGDRYATEVHDAIQAEWKTPRGLIAESELNRLTATVRVRISPDGRIKSSKISRPSGNRLFDQSIEEAFAQVRRLPVPPPEIADMIMRSGFELEFGKEK